MPDLSLGGRPRAVWVTAFPSRSGNEGRLFFTTATSSAILMRAPRELLSLRRDSGGVRDCARATFFLVSRTGAFRDAKVCPFTNTPDTHFVIDFHPSSPTCSSRVRCLGHGFKFASAIGELQADLLTDGRSRFDLSLFRLARFNRVIASIARDLAGAVILKKRVFACLSG